MLAAAPTRAFASDCREACILFLVGYALEETVREAISSSLKPRKRRRFMQGAKARDGAWVAEPADGRLTCGHEADCRPEDPHLGVCGRPWTILIIG
jgi:hypothetical protein